MAVVLFAFLTTPLMAKKKPVLGNIPRRQQSAEIANVAEVVAGQKCANWSWAAALETALRAQGVELAQNYWIVRAHGGEVCIDDPPRTRDLARLIEGEHTLADGRRVRLSARAVEGAPTVIDDLIAAMRRNRPMLLLWRGQGYVLYGMSWDESYFPTGSRSFEVRALKLADPFARGEKRLVTFEKEKDDPAEIGGTVEVVVEP